MPDLEKEETVVEPEIVQAKTEDNAEAAVEEPVFATECAFIIFKDPNTNRWIANSEIPQTIRVIRDATMDDFYLGCQSVCRDVLAHETATRVSLMQDQKMAQAVKQMENARIAQQLAGGGVDLTKLR